MREPVVQLVQLKLLYQADGSARRKIKKDRGEENAQFYCVKLVE